MLQKRKMREQPDIIFRDILGYENYQIGENGEVYNKKTGQEIKQSIRTGYYSVRMINDDGNVKNVRIHRLLGGAFISNPLNKKIIDHIDRNRLNNNLENLRWVTSSENNTNKTVSSKNKLGIVGITDMLHNNKMCWCAYIKKNKKAITKSFPYTEEGFKQAVEWRKTKEQELHKIL